MGLIFGWVLRLHTVRGPSDDHAHFPVTMVQKSKYENKHDNIDFSWAWDLWSLRVEGCMGIYIDTDNPVGGIVFYHY